MGQGRFHQPCGQRCPLWSHLVAYNDPCPQHCRAGPRKRRFANHRSTRTDSCTANFANQLADFGDMAIQAALGSIPNPSVPIREGLTLSCS